MSAHHGSGGNPVPELLDKAQDMANALVSRILGLTDSVVSQLEALVRKPKTVTTAASKSDHKRAASFLEKGRRRYNKKRYENAQTLFVKALEYDPQYTQARYFYGLVLYKLDRTQDAVTQWHAVIDLEPNSAFAAKAHSKIDRINSNISQVVGELESHLKE